MRASKSIVEEIASAYLENYISLPNIEDDMSVIYYPDTQEYLFNTCWDHTPSKIDLDSYELKGDKIYALINEYDGMDGAFMGKYQVILTPNKKTDARFKYRVVEVSKIK